MTSYYQQRYGRNYHRDTLYILLSIAAGGFFCLILMCGGCIISLQRSVPTPEEIAKMQELLDKQKLPENNSQPEPPKEETPQKTALDELDEDKTVAWVMGKAYVAAMLKSPATADFHDSFWSGEQDSIKNVDVNGDVFTVHGYVDSQNSFGALMRSDFIVRLERVKSDGTFKLLPPIAIEQR